ncbi:hypothetical protein ACFV7R_14625 [Streptomyces sp. NPDC059866]|uniref:hypothetical protein n=1 Tax=Streptomyces sp. NPDC059866 TaxID=3346978 RepID=UPI00364BF897
MYRCGWVTKAGQETVLAREIHALVSDGDLDSAARLLPQEHPYPVGDELLAHLRGRRADSPHSRLRPMGHMAAQTRRDGGQTKYPVRSELGSFLPDGHRSGAGEVAEPA